MSQQEPFFDRFSGVDEILEQIEADLRTLIAAEGIADTDGPNHVVQQPYEYGAIPDDYYPLGFPQGITTIDFEDGTISHSGEGYEGVSDAEEFYTGLRTYADMTRDISGANLQGLRSVMFNVDVPVAVSLNDNGWINLWPGSSQVIKSLGFLRIKIRSPYNYHLRGAVSTRVGSWDGVADKTSLTRVGDRTTTTDSWEFVRFWPPGMDDTLSGSSVDHTDYQQRTIPADGYGDAGIILENTSTAANSLDARILARDDWAGGSSSSPTWYQIGDSIFEAEAAYLTQGDHYHWFIDVPHTELAVQINNETAGDTVSADASLTLN